MFDANLRHFQPGQHCWIRIHTLAKNTRLFEAGFRPGQDAQARIVEFGPAPGEQEPWALRIELERQGQWYPAHHNAPIQHELLVFQCVYPTAPELLRPNDPRTQKGVA